MKAKYFGGFRYLLECDSAEEMMKLLHEGKEALSTWFEWVKPWQSELDLSSSRSLDWLSIRGVSLHFWNEENFRKVASVWGEVVEVEDLASNHVQAHIGRVSVLIRGQNFVNESLMLCCEEAEFQVDVLEDASEIIDFGPRYDISRVNT